MPDSTLLPEVSVIMATYNEPGEIIRQSVQSILSQTFTNLELIILDDSTSEETRMALDFISSDPRVHIIRSKSRMGFVHSLNIGLQKAKGEFIARMDGDDISLPNRLDIQVNFLKKHPSISVVGGSMYIINEDGNILSKRKYPTSNFLLKLLSIYRNPLAHPTVLMRKECVDKGFLYDVNFGKAEDLELWLRLQRNGFKIANVPDFVLNYRICGDLSEKRTIENWKFNLKARTRNYSLRAPFSGLIGIFVSYLYTKLPKFVIRATYNKENSQKS